MIVFQIKTITRMIPQQRPMALMSELNMKFNLMHQSTEITTTFCLPSLTQMRMELTQVSTEVTLTRTTLMQSHIKRMLQLKLTPLRSWELTLQSNLTKEPLHSQRTGETLLSTKPKEERTFTK